MSRRASAQAFWQMAGCFAVTMAWPGSLAMSSWIRMVRRAAVAITAGGGARGRSGYIVRSAVIAGARRRFDGDPRPRKDVDESGPGLADDCDGTGAEGDCYRRRFYLGMVPVRPDDRGRDASAHA